MVGLTPGMVKDKMKYLRVPDDEAWRVPVLKELMDGQLSVPGFSEAELDYMKNYLCTS